MRVCVADEWVVKDPDGGGHLADVLVFHEDRGSRVFCAADVYPGELQSRLAECITRFRSEHHENYSSIESFRFALLSSGLSDVPVVYVAERKRYYA